MKLSLLIVLCPLLPIGISDAFLRSKVNTRIEKSRSKSKGLTIQFDEKLEFKAISSYNVDGTKEYKQIVEFIASKNSISVDGEVYSLGNVEEYSIWSSNEAKMYLDGKEFKYGQPPVFHFGKVGDVELLIGQTHISRRIDTIEIYNDSIATTLVLNDTMNVIDSNNLNNSYLEEDSFNFSQSYLHNDTIDDYWAPEVSLNATGDDTKFQFQTQGSCGVYRQIEVAIAFDSSFCKFMGGFDAAVERVQYIVALASNKYHQAGLCLSVKLKAIDGRCNLYDDPYSKMLYWKSGCLSNNGLIHDFSAYFDSNMKYIPKDAAHLFTAQTMDGPLGCSGLASLCRNAYGVNQMSFTNDLTLQTSLFTHELAHNCGASHNNKNGHIMNKAVNHGRNGFTSQSIKQMLSYLKTVTCLVYSNN